MEMGESHGFELVDTLGLSAVKRINEYQGQGGKVFLHSCKIVEPGEYLS